VKGNASRGCARCTGSLKQARGCGRAAPLDPLAFDGIVELAHRPGDEPLLADLDRWATGGALVARQRLAVRGPRTRRGRRGAKRGRRCARAHRFTTKPPYEKPTSANSCRSSNSTWFHEVAHVGAQVDQRARQVDALAEAGEARREDSVAGGLQQPPDVRKPCAPLHAPVDEDETLVMVSPAGSRGVPGASAPSAAAPASRVCENEQCPERKAHARLPGRAAHDRHDGGTEVEPGALPRPR
jgi:hypothetical protein